MLSATLLTSCRTTGSGATIESARFSCAAFAPIWWSTRDTGGTVAQIKEHNAAWRALCRTTARPSLNSP
jgi:hypothetical protein